MKYTLILHPHDAAELDQVLSDLLDSDVLGTRIITEAEIHIDLD
ncbi:hypothetical protein SEA_JUANYO_55 [Microbacterium phage Juanyo]|nr:hypothetical protein SEA_JUANYO_55 [Microbacterium phage Juanyo]